VKGVLVTAVVCLAVGIGVFLGYCHGTTGFQFSDSISAVSIHLDITTTGVAAIVGLVLTLAGAFLLTVATVIALIAIFRRKGESGPMKRRENAFEE